MNSTRTFKSDTEPGTVKGRDGKTYTQKEQPKTLADLYERVTRRGVNGSSTRLHACKGCSHRAASEAAHSLTMCVTYTLKCGRR